MYFVKTDENIIDKSDLNRISAIQTADEDQEIIREVLFRSVEAYRLLVSKYQVPVYNLLLRMVHDQDNARELTQEVFVKAYKALPIFRFEFRFFSWLYRMAVNLALNHLKMQKGYVSLELIKNMPVEEDEKDDEKHLQLKMAVNQLKDKYKALVVLKYYQQLSYTEIACILKLPEKKVRSRLYDARMQLKNMLERSGYFK
jgi:RNA polymerase sigma-70 factor, ECF subfamily